MGANSSFMSISSSTSQFSLRGEGRLAVGVDVHLGPLGLPPFDQVARIPTPVAVEILDDAQPDFARRYIVEPQVARRDVAPLLQQAVRPVEQLHDILRIGSLALDVQPDRGEFLGVGHRIGTAQRIVLFVGDILESTRRHEQLVLAAQLPVSFSRQTHVGRIAFEPHLGRTRFGCCSVV